MFLLFLVLLTFGAVNVLAPQFVWRMRSGRTTDGGSQSTAALLTLSRLAGMFALLAALFLLMNGL
ncbi:hypothetical protein [Saccharibacillus kuerlensis]|uniref:DUF6199 domain-containing protein n=1 Tax=Saccharibacillus kuerlensis TaxID=459527 RepID=A0ABQ2KZC2_9BACL|nr:hypothetical protein [Saccharibacillus kuerlensis]GGN97069.1 hypothetical protein GCM10010969_14630 [Saccharibacillus kuerlensis]